jgi:outer membrane lipoprotein carrier protein
MRSILLLLSILLALPVQAEEAPDPFVCASPLTKAEEAELLDSVTERYERFSDLSASFSQSSYFVGLGKRVKSEGNVRFKKPGMMDWNYSAPDEQRFVADGKTLWFFQPDLNQVTLGEFEDSFSSDLPVSFLLGIGSLQEKFKLLSACRTQAGILAKLGPAAADPNLDEFFLLIDSKTKVPKGAKIIDVGGNETGIVFEDIVLDKELPKEEFRFSIPRGVDIIDRRGEGTKRSRFSS